MTDKLRDLAVHCVVESSLWHVPIEEVKKKLEGSA